MRLVAGPRRGIIRNNDFPHFHENGLLLLGYRWIPDDRDKQLSLGIKKQKSEESLESLETK